MLTDALLAPRVSGAAARDDLACTHCGLPVPRGREAPEGGPSFCCGGCEGVYRLLTDAGLDDYYALRDATDTPARRPSVTDRTYAELDAPAFLEAHCRRDGARLSTDLVLEGIHCAACVWLVEKVARLRPGVLEARLSLESGVLRVSWESGAVALSTIARTLDDLGYPVHARHGVTRAELDRKEDRDLLIRLGVAGAAAANAMMLAIALYAGAFDGMAPEHAALFRWASLVVSVPAILYAGAAFFRGAWSALRARSPHMDLPVSIGILAGTVGGVVGTVRGSGEIYFDSVTALVFLLLAGRWVQRRRQRAAVSAADLVSALAPATARVVTRSGSRDVAAGDVAPGDRVEIRAGERIPVDGEVLEGRSAVDASLLTGESVPVEVAPGDAVFAGTSNVASRLVVLTRRAGAATRVAELVAKMEEARLARAPVVLLADRVAAVFVVAVLGLAALTFALWVGEGVPRALEATMALLVVTCPCALGLATPLTMSSALGQAAGAGLLVKGGAALEALARPGLVVFDKTGTLTAGRLTLEETLGDASLLDLVARAEALSSHPLARAFDGLAQGASPPAGDGVEGFQETPGRGIAARVGGVDLAVGTLAHVRAALPLPASVEAHADALARRGLTPVVAAASDGRAAVFGLGDAPRPEAAASLRALSGMGHRLAVVSGDRPEVVQSVAERLGVTLDVVRGGASPEDKLAFVTEARLRGPVFMVGDGVNDAAALGAATAGIAVHGGAEASLAAADVFATDSGLAPIVRAFEGARRTLRVLAANVALSLVYNVAAASLAVAGLIGPLLAAVLMPLSSITVVTLSYRSRMFRRGPA